MRTESPSSRAVQRRRDGPALPDRIACAPVLRINLGHGREEQVRHRRARIGDQPAVAALHDGLRVAGAPDWSCPAFVDPWPLCRGGVPMAESRPPYAPEYRRQMVELVRAGRMPGELAREFECSAQAV